MANNRHVMTKDNLNLNSILEECIVGQEKDKNFVLSKFVELEDRYTLEEMTQIYNFLLKKETDPDTLMIILKRINSYLPKECLDTLLDLLLLKEDFKDNLSKTEKYIDVRVNTAKVISNYKDNRAVLPILYCMNNKDENYKIRLACAEALGRIGDKYAVTPLIDLVSDENEKSVYVRESAATALGMIGDMRAVDSLVHILEAKKSFLDKFTFLKERVIEALSKLNSQGDRVFRALRNSLDDESPQIRINAIEAIMNSDDERAFETIKKMLFDKNDEVVENAVIALYNLNGADILSEIIDGDEYPFYARECAKNLYREYEEDGQDEE